MKRKNLFITLLLVICIIFGTSFNVSADVLNNNDNIWDYKSHNLEKDYASKWLKLNGYGINELSNPIELYSIDGSIGAICFDLNNTGYLVINAYNLDIMEYSFSNKKPFGNYNNVIYNGPLQFYIKNDENTIDLFTNSIIDKENLSNNYIINKISTEDKNSKIEKLKDNAFFASNSFVESGSLSGSLVTWSSSYYCQPDCAAILLRYLYNRNSAFLPSGYTTNGNVQDYLTNTYILNGATTSSKVVNGGEPYQEYDGSTLVTKYTKGMIQYLVDRGLSSSYTAVFSWYDFSTIRNMINSNFPVSFGTSSTVPGSTWDESHQVVAHGYLVGYDGVPFIYVNDTFGNNNISINGSAKYYSNYGMWYIN